MPALKTSQLQGQISSILRKSPEACVIGLKTTNSWHGPPSITVSDRVFMIVECYSQLAMREAIITARSKDNGLVILTDLHENKLPTDLRLQLTRRRLIPLRPWLSVKEHFKAKNIDPAIVKKQWLAETLLNAIPANGFPSVPHGFLTSEAIWREFFSLVLGLESAKPDVGDLLAWSLDREKVKKYHELPDRQKSDITEWIQKSAGPIGNFLFSCLENSKISLMSLGLCFAIISHKTGKGFKELNEAKIRLEQYTGKQTLTTEQYDQLSMACLDVIKERIRSNDWDCLHHLSNELESLLDEIQISNYAWLSSLSQKGFEQNAVFFAQGIEKLVQSGESDDQVQLWKSMDRMRHHTYASKNSKRLKRIEMAYRLCRCFLEHDSEIQFDKIGEITRFYAKEGAFIDRARNSLIAGDNCQELRNAFKKLLEKCDDYCNSLNHSFAKLMAHWTKSASSGDDVHKIEDVLSNIVYPIAKQGPVILIVMDGMSQGVFAEVKEDLIFNRKWSELTLGSNDFSKPVLAVLPTTTDVSRKALLCGSISIQNYSDEAKGFSQNQKLKEISPSKPPILFTKSDLTSSGPNELPENIANEIRSTKRKIIGVIINAVDDFLYKSDQISVSWNIENIPILDQIIHLAKQAERTIIITSDHGHVLEFHSTFYSYEQSERWREDDGKLNDGEILISGSRVLKPKTGKVIVPWSEHIRYGKKKNGYHGGVSLQEAVIPLSVLSSSDKESDWKALPYFQPSWWDVQSDPEKKKVIEKTAGNDEKEAALDLPDLPIFTALKKNLSQQKVIDIDKLLKSPVYENQKNISGRVVVSDDLVRRFIETLITYHGTIILPTLAQELNEPILRIRGIVTKIQNLLNVEGYQVVGFDTASETINLHFQLLKTQFNL